MVSTDKLMHFLVGLVIGVLFWQMLKRWAPGSTRRINPGLFLVMVVWGASGLFLFRKLGIPLLSADWVYMAVPDWDIPLYKLTQWRFLIHRSWLFHSTLIPTALIWLSVWQLGQRSHRAWKWILDGAMGLSVGMATHLVWDTLASKRGFVVHGWNAGGSLLWLIASLVAGFGIPWLIAWAIHRPSSLDTSG
ncbi:hypothetical protein ACQ4M4_13345 [Leptolyngbya sp. AN02str]|uniref:hypothetical protein n=1 Tax=Leptolyngbya sp. AN02str TaxID=3423363 RepID=UPI003D31FA03